MSRPNEWATTPLPPLGPSVAKRGENIYTYRRNIESGENREMKSGDWDSEEGESENV
eukprot:SAG31_NODE_5754_length_2343_cov_2.869430_2_plen_57_part_00